MKNFVRAGLLAFTLGLTVAGCAGTISKLETVYNDITSVRADSKSIVLAMQAFDVAKVGATGYLRLRRCNGTNGPICRDPGVTVQLDNAIQAGTQARNSLKAWLRVHPDGIGPQDVFDKLNAVTAFVEKVIAPYTASR